MIAAVRAAFLVLLVLLALHSLYLSTHPHVDTIVPVRPNALRYLDPLSPNATEPENTPTTAPPKQYGTLHAIPEEFYIPNNNYTGAPHENVYRANATFVMLARNSDADGVVQSVKDVEMKFNQKWGYPWVFLNDEPFDESFKRRVSVLIKSPVEFGVVPKEHWVQPVWIDETRAKQERNKLISQNVPYGGSVSYRNMCRFNSGFFFHHPLLQKYRWYWRVEPDVNFSCDIDFDPFVFLERTNKTYGFTISMYEYDRTVASLWSYVKEFMKIYPEHIAPGNSLGFISPDNGETYNLCHFWSNFEIADLDFWRGPAYTDFFRYLDSKGGFYYERWGDAPVHTIAAALLLPSEKIHFFNEIGYQHTTANHCPMGGAWKRGKCICGPDKSFDYHKFSCLKHWDALVGPFKEG